jgi:sigma-B regulation protein RsbU (phosphoserine phosphatase)
MTHNERAADRLARQSFFAGIPHDVLEPLVQHCAIRELAPDEVLLSPGEANDALFLLLEGRLRVNIDRVGADDGFAIEPGECVGEISIIDGKPASAFVVADRPSVVAAIPEARFWSDFMATPAIARNFMRLMAERFRARNQLMQQALEERLRYEHLERELGIAHELQLGMLPQDIDLSPEVDVAASMAPARHIGGDFYDLFPTGGDQTCVAIGDVAGKGVPAALFMVRTMTLLRGELLKQQPLEEAMRRLNAALCQDNPRCMFVTLVVGLLDGRSGEFRYAVAGHNPLIHGTADGVYRYLPRPHGILAGVDDGAAYEVATLQLAPGELLLLYTDGITEAMNQARELFAEERLLACLGGGPNDSSAAVANTVHGAVERFVDGAPQSDDLTLVVLRYRGK